MSRRRVRTNPDEIQQAAKLAEKFHGRADGKIREIEESAAARDTLADLGRLVALEVILPSRDRAKLEPSGVRLAASPDGKQLYFVGGDQSLNIRALGLTARDHVELGELDKLIYCTRKGFHNFERIDYVHKMGEDGGRRPVLAYDSLNEKLYVIGGTYQVRPEGIVR